MPTPGRRAISRCRRRRASHSLLPARPTTKEMGPLAEGWRPWRAIAARLLWTYYRAVKKREGVLLETAAQKPAAKTAAKRQRGKDGR